MQKQAFKHNIKGFVKNGYEPVLEMFESLFEGGYDKNSQLSVYVGEENVIELCGSADDSKYNEDTMGIIFSNGKSIAAIILSLMVEKGLLDYNKPVADYWPEFAQNGKDKILVADVMRHEAGLHRFHKLVKLEDCFTENIKKNSIGSIIETDTSIKSPGIGRHYHAVTRDWITNEIFRRVEPQGRTFDEYWRQELAPKVGDGISIACSEEELKNVFQANWDAGV